MTVLDTRIDQIVLTPLAIPIKVPFAIATETIPKAELIVVALTSQAVHQTGYGEASPFPTLTFDTAKSSYEALKQWSQSLYHKTIGEALAFLREEANTLRRQSITAHAALEMALYDLLAKTYGIPLRDLFGQSGLNSIETDITVPLMDNKNVPSFFRDLAPADIRIVKIKVKGDVGADEALVREVASAVGPSLQFSLDGNQGYSLPHALSLCERLKRHGLEPLFFEQPFPLDDWESNRAFMQRPPCRLCLDETVKTPADAIRVIKENAAHMINLKVMKSGVHYTQVIATLARSAGLGLMMGGMLESDIAMGFSLQFAAGFGGIEAIDLDTPYFFSTQLTEDSPWANGTAKLRVPAKLALDAACPLGQP